MFTENCPRTTSCLSFAGRDLIHHLFYAPRFDHVATLTALCDETGIHDDAPITGVGGYVFDEDGHRNFTASWFETLRPFKDRGIEFFHAGDCFEGHGKFAALIDTERDGLFRSLISLIRATAKVGLLCSLEDQAFETAIRSNKLRVYSGSKYTACALRMFSFVGDWMRRSELDGSVLYLFENGYEYWKEADCMIEQAAARPDFREASFYSNHDFQSKRGQLAFQAADLFLWLWQKYKREKVKHEYFVELIKPPRRIPHIEREVTHLDVFHLAFGNMDKGIKSNRKKSPDYDLQTGEVRTYRF